MSIIHAYSKKILQPYAGLIQIAESKRARALSLDGNTWEIQFVRGINNENRKPSGPDVPHSYVRVASVERNDIQKMVSPDFIQDNDMDDRVVELAEFIVDAEFPFPATDHYEYWLLDKIDETPLALIFSCSDSCQMPTFPSRTEWTALSSAVMPIDKTSEEVQRGEAPVNYRLQRLVAERAGNKPKAKWFQRQVGGRVEFPPLLLREDWESEIDSRVCERYIQRQSPRLLMLPGLGASDRLRMEQAARNHALEVDYYFPLYPDIADQKLMKAIRVEARLRSST